MSTRARIGKVYEGLSGASRIKTIYCHWDGYPSYTGAMLYENYNDDKKLDDLLDLGDISVLRKNISTDKPHTFDNPQKDVVIAYHRDRGEQRRILELDYDEFREYIEDSDIEYVYLRYKGEWLYAPVEWDKIAQRYILGGFRDLEDKIKELKRKGMI